MEISRSLTSCFCACWDFWGIAELLLMSTGPTVSHWTSPICPLPFLSETFWCRKWSAKNQCRFSIWNQRGLLPYLAQSSQIKASENIIACDTRGVNTPLTKSNNRMRWMRSHRTNSSVWNHASVSKRHRQADQSRVNTSALFSKAVCPYETGVWQSECWDRLNHLTPPQTRIHILSINFTLFVYFKKC